MPGVLSFLLEKVRDFAVDRILDTAWGFTQEEIPKVCSVKSELEELENKLRSMQPILRDADNKQFISIEVKDWMFRLSDVVYDANDLIDLYRVREKAMPTDVEQTKVRKIYDSLSGSRKNISFLYEIDEKIKEINERLSVLYKEKDLFGLVPVLEESGFGHNVGVIPREERQTISAITEPKIVGREEDEVLVIKWLVEESQENEESASVVAIVGMGGLGKTALAKKIYNNHIMKQCFDKCMWVCVSEMPKKLDLFRKILEEVDEERNGSQQLIGSNALYSHINSRLKDKKFLLVLDDLWDYGWWNELRSLWQGSRSGSKVLITTRQMDVAHGMEVAHSHELTCLTEEQSWQLFVNRALRKGEVEEELDVVNDVGKDIVKKCGGLPLALNTVGSLLRQKERRKSVWEDVFNSPFWSWRGPQNNGNVFAAIALSYMNIPFPLKQCLTFCCVFPKDFVMRKENLVRLWVAEGFVLKEGGVEMEVSAERYLDDLVNCSLIQAKMDSTGEFEYTLHDIVHDFALYIRREEYASVCLVKTEKVSHHARIFSSVGGDCSLDALGEQEKLRVLMWLQIHRFSAFNFAAFRWLRILDLSKSNISELPQSIGDLTLLKYINLSGTKILELPKSITKLHDLLTLDLSDSHIKRLPNKISGLSALRHLDVRRTNLLECMPNEIGKLTCLQTLSNFVVGSNRTDRRGCSLQQLRELNNLRGHLSIHHIERVCNMEEVKHAKLKRKKNLQSLALTCDIKCMIEFNQAFSEELEHVYEGLQAPTGIENLEIIGYAGLKSPTWMSYTTYSCLKEIIVSDCRFLRGLPNLGRMPNLVRLEIYKAQSVKVFDTTFDHVYKQVAYPKLERLSLKCMDMLEDWLFDAYRKTMPRLRRLQIIRCKRLRILPFFPTLDELEIRNMDRWDGWPMAKEREMPCLKKMHIKFCETLTLFPSCPKLEELEVDSCNKLVELPCSLVLARALIKNCTLVSSPSDAMPNLQNLKHLEIVGAPKLAPLLEKLEDMKELRLLDVRGMPDLTMLLREGSHNLGKLETLRIEDCWNLTSLPAATRLKSLTLRNLPQLESLPLTLLEDIKGVEKLGLGPNLGSVRVQGLLQCLEITRLRELKLSGVHDLGMEWLESIISDLVQLEELALEDCPQLMSITDMLKNHPLAKLRILSIGCFDYCRPKIFSVDKLTCVLLIDSLQMSNKLAGLADLSSRIGGLIVKLLPGVDSLPEWIQQLRKLEYLRVDESAQLTHLPDWLQKLSKLEFLDLDDLPELRDLPHAITNLHQLEVLRIVSCPKLSSLPDGLQGLPRLQILYVERCPLLVERCRKEEWDKIGHIPLLVLE